MPGRSDVDFVATLAHRPSEAEVEALRRAHLVVAERHPEPAFDGMHVLVDDLRADPRVCPDAPAVLHGHFEPETRMDVEVAWHELARHGVTVAGPDVATLGVWDSQDVLLAFTRDNLDTYWRGTAESLAAHPVDARSEWACEWCVLGVARLHHLLVTGEMTSKGGGGRWGLGHYPEEHHRVLREALRIRFGGDAEHVSGSDGQDWVRGRDVAAFVAHVVAVGTSGG